MTEVFADTFYWLALLNPSDSHHRRVVQEPVNDRVVTSRAVQIEVMDALCERRLRPLAVQFWRDTCRVPTLIVVPLEDQLLDRAATLFANRGDKDWSMTDCITFVIMAERGISSALTGDHHFEQAGFQIRFQ
jgi:predicted nucleic acid-binding protein